MNLIPLARNGEYDESQFHRSIQHTVFGKIVRGIEVLHTLEQVPTEDKTKLKVLI